MHLVAFAVPVDNAAVDGSSGLGGVAAKDITDGLELSGISTLGSLVDEPLDGFGAAAPSERTLVGEVLATERLGELLEVNEAVSEGLGGGRGARGINVLQEGVEETAIGLLVVENGGDDEVVVASGAGLLVGDLEFTSVALAVDGVVSGQTKGDGLHIIARTVARVATAQSDETKRTGGSGSDLDSSALLLHGAVSSGGVVTTELVLVGAYFAGTDALGVVENDVDRALVLTRLAKVRVVSCWFGGCRGSSAGGLIHAQSHTRARQSEGDQQQSDYELHLCF